MKIEAFYPCFFECSAFKIRQQGMCCVLRSVEDYTGRKSFDTDTFRKSYKIGKF